MGCIDRRPRCLVVLHFGYVFELENIEVDASASGQRDHRALCWLDYDLARASTRPFNRARAPAKIRPMPILRIRPARKPGALPGMRCADRCRAIVPRVPPPLSAVCAG